jgi:hypothetical protein
MRERHRIPAVVFRTACCSVEHVLQIMAPIQCSHFNCCNLLCVRVLTECDLHRLKCLLSWGLLDVTLTNVVVKKKSVFWDITPCSPLRELWSLLASGWFFALLILRLWRWGRHVPPNLPVCSCSFPDNEDKHQYFIKWDGWSNWWYNISYGVSFWVVWVSLWYGS